ncbi:hypothetical protein LG943_12245 [Streptomonospora sp. S1-112]|uniref:Uncharacterized protein n=1 Tax=Streptomonospora mangrovi TaxID=2883123 RepID=A0A9X3NJQ1_9ACTN|nr:hypothetical protein [Streptomonospora mangrovi]MDA0565084.1 hypothetical protein [Streptomonospora mangrovi]
MGDGRGVHEIRLGVYATEEEAAEIKRRITRLLCPDPDHAGPCPVPWSVALLEGEEDAYPELVEQARAERGADQ